MADWRVVENTGRTIVRLIDRQLVALGVPNVTVGLTTAAAFSALATTASPFVSVFLFQIGINGELRNRPRQRRPDGSYGRQALPLELSYLVTPWGVRVPNDVASDSVAAREEARLLGAVMQALYDHAEVGRGDLFEPPLSPVWLPQDGLQIMMETLPVDQHYRIWDAAELGYHLSVVYRVRVASLDPDPEPLAPPVVEARLEPVP
jgi:hypothetical protein